MSNLHNTIVFKQVIIVLNNEIKIKIENFPVDVDFSQFQKQLSYLMNEDLESYQISFQSSQEKQNKRESITDQYGYVSYINKAHISEYETIHIFLDQISNKQQVQSLRNQQIQDSYFKGQKIHEIFEIGQVEVQDGKVKNNTNTKSILDSYRNEIHKNYDVTEAIIETSEQYPSLQLSNVYSKQKSSDLETFNAQYIKKQSFTNFNIASKSYENIQSNEVDQITPNNDQNNRENLENMINYEIIRQLKNRFPQLTPENIEDDVRVKKYIQQLQWPQSQNKARIFGISPQPKQNKKINDLFSGNTPCEFPIKFERFHCLVCQDYDHCEKCQLLERGEHNHPFMKYKNKQFL